MFQLLKLGFIAAIASKLWAPHFADDAGSDSSGDGDKSGSDSRSGSEGESDSASGSEGDKKAEVGEGARKAIDAEKARADVAEKARKKAEAELAKLQKAQMSEQDRAVEEAKEEARKTARAEAFKEIGEELLIARAASKMNVPEGRIAGLFNLEELMTDEGKFDRAKADKAIEDLLKEVPSLKRDWTPSKGGPDHFNGSSGGGADDGKAIGRAARAIFERKK